jgi:hypothetical protein
VFLIFDTERREIVVDWIRTPEEAKATLAELVKADPEAEGILVILDSLGWKNWHWMGARWAPSGGRRLRSGR